MELEREENACLFCQIRQAAGLGDDRVKMGVIGLERPFVSRPDPDLRSTQSDRSLEHFGEIRPACGAEPVIGSVGGGSEAGIFGDLAHLAGIGGIARRNMDVPSPLNGPQPCLADQSNNVPGGQLSECDGKQSGAEHKKDFQPLRASSI